MEEEHDLNLDKIIYIDLISQKKPSYGGSNNCIIILGSDTKQKWSLFTKSKEDLTGKVTPFLNKVTSSKKNVKIIICNNACKNKTLKENCAEFTKKSTFN